MLAYGVLTNPLTIRQMRAGLGCLSLGCLVLESHGKPREATEETEETKETDPWGEGWPQMPRAIFPSADLTLSGSWS